MDTPLPSSRDERVYDKTHGTTTFRAYLLAGNLPADSILRSKEQLEKNLKGNTFVPMTRKSL
jgi:hypothetical protein